MKSAKYKVCILAAGGSGPDMGALAEYVNRGVLPVNNKATISYIVEKFPKNVEFVVAVGYKKETIIDYLKLAHPERKFTFVTIKKFSGPGSGPGVSLLACKKHLQSPFIFSTTDTIVLEAVPAPDHNWMGVAPVHDTEQYCTVKVRSNLVYQVDDKIKTDNHLAFIGLAGIKDYKTFFKALESDKEAIAGEFQVSTGLKVLIEKRLVPVGFTWFDTGHLENYIETNKNFSGENKFDFSKSNEFLYFVNGRVIKFFADRSVTDKRHQRAQKGLKGLTPKIEAKRGHFYSYKMVEGHTLYSVLNAQITEDFLKWAKTHLWKKLKLSLEQGKIFQEAVVKFYKDKTEERVASYAKKKGNREAEFINGLRVPGTKELLRKIDWKHLTSGEATNFHGDLQFDNILINPKAKKFQEKFILLDWRHEFGGLVHAGDLYYDLAKLYGGMIISYPLIKEGMFSSKTDGKEAHYHYFIKNDLLEAREHYEKFLTENGYDLKKVKTLTALIFLNMAPLHHAPFDEMLSYMGRSLLHKIL